jgi:putative ABC transport system ATP-binding protein
MRQAFLRVLFQECEESSSTLLFVSHDRQLESQFERHIALDEINQIHLEAQ